MKREVQLTLNSVVHVLQENLHVLSRAHVERVARAKKRATDLEGSTKVVGGHGKWHAAVLGVHLEKVLAENCVVGLDDVPGEADNGGVHDGNCSRQEGRGIWWLR